MVVDENQAWDAVAGQVWAANQAAVGADEAVDQVWAVDADGGRGDEDEDQDQTHQVEHLPKANAAFYGQW